MPNNKICFVIVWFGDLPAWLPYFLKSCSCCEGIDWQIFTDSTKVPVSPENVKFRHLTKSDFEGRVGERLNRSYQFSYGYKLCDMKPAYGDFFSEFLDNYDYWGYSDLDVLLGNPLPLLKKAKALEADVITAGSRLLVGHFTLLRNTDRFRLLYRECVGWEEKFQSRDYCTFDEQEFSDHVRSLQTAGILSLCVVPLWQEDCLIEWSGRKGFFILWRRGQLWDLLTFSRYGYFHFIRTKYRKELLPVPASHPGDWFVLTERGFQPVNSTAEKLRCFATLVSTAARTIPWYGKQFLKCLMPRQARIWIRERLFGPIQAQR